MRRLTKNHARPRFLGATESFFKCVTLRFISIALRQHNFQRADHSNLGKAVADPDFYEDIITRIKAVPEWLVVGPAKAKLDFSKHLTRRHADLVDHMIGLETVDHPSDGQLLAFAKKYFMAADRMAGVPTPS